MRRASASSLEQRFPTLLLFQGLAHVAQLSQQGRFPDRQADVPGLFRERLQYALAHPPYGITDEAASTGIVETLRRAD